jgi:hypothetical protein
VEPVAHPLGRAPAGGPRRDRVARVAHPRSRAVAARARGGALGHRDPRRRAGRRGTLDPGRRQVRDARLPAPPRRRVGRADRDDRRVRAPDPGAGPRGAALAGEPRSAPGADPGGARAAEARDRCRPGVRVGAPAEHGRRLRRAGRAAAAARLRRPHRLPPRGARDGAHGAEPPRQPPAPGRGKEPARRARGARDARPRALDGQPEAPGGGAAAHALRERARDALGGARAQQRGARALRVRRLARPPGAAARRRQPRPDPPRGLRGQARRGRGRIDPPRGRGSAPHARPDQRPADLLAHRPAERAAAADGFGGRPRGGPRSSRGRPRRVRGADRARRGAARGPRRPDAARPALPEPRRERREVPRPGGARGLDHGGAPGGRLGLLRARQRHRDRAPALGADLRALRAPPRAPRVPRHGDRPRDLQEDRRAPRRTDLGRVRARPGLRLPLHGRAARAARADGAGAGEPRERPRGAALSRGTRRGAAGRAGRRAPAERGL